MLDEELEEERRLRSETDDAEGDDFSDSGKEERREERNLKDYSTVWSG